MHLLYHKALGHLGDPPTRPLPAQAQLDPVATAPRPPPRLDAEPPTTDLPDPSTTISLRPSTRRPRGIGAELMARARKRASEEDGMTKEELMKMYRKKASSKRGGIGSNVCGLKRRDTKDACTLILTRAREAHKMSKEHGNVCVTCS